MRLRLAVRFFYLTHPDSDRFKNSLFRYDAVYHTAEVVHNPSFDFYFQNTVKVGHDHLYAVSIKLGVTRYTLSDAR